MRGREKPWANNHQCPAQWVLCPLLSDPKCIHFAQWTLRKFCNTVKEQNLFLKTEACLRLLSRALGLWIPSVEAGSLHWAPVLPAIPPTRMPHGLWPSMPLQPSCSTQGTADWDPCLGFMCCSSPQSLTWHPDAQSLGVLVPERIRTPFHKDEIQRQV